MEEQQGETGEKKKEAGLKKTTIWLMISVALFFDLLQVILDFFLMGWTVTIFGAMTFWLWFKLHGYSFWKPKRIGWSLVTLLTDAVPILGWFSWTLAITIFTLKNKLQETVPGAGLAMSVVDGKMTSARNNAAVDKMQRLGRMDKNSDGKKMKPQRSPLNNKEDLRGSRFKEIMQRREESEQRQRKFIADYGGDEKYQKDLNEVKFKYSDSEWNKRNPAA